MNIPENAMTVHVPLRWSDMDAYGHVNNVQFLRLLEDARIYAFENWFGRERGVLGEGLLVARHEIEYRQPLVYRQEPIPISMWISKLGGASYDIGYVVHNGEGTEYAIAESTMVAYDFERETARRISESDKESLKQFIAPPAPFRHRSVAK